jgi:hypothetical protein
MNLRTASRLVSLGTFLLFGAGFLAMFIGNLSPNEIFPLFFGLFVVSIILRGVLALLQFTPSLERISAALTGDTDPALGDDWQRGVESDRARALAVFTSGRAADGLPLVGHSSGTPARVSYEKLKGTEGGTYLLTFASLDAIPTGHTVIAMRGPRRPWQSLAANLVELPGAPAALGSGWRVAASDPAAVDAVITSGVAEALAQSRASVAAAAWVDGEVTVIEDGNRTSPTRLAEMLRLAARLG